MTTIERVKHEGAVKALKDRISSLQYELIHRNWEGILNKSKYTRLGDALCIAESLLNDMRETLNALRELEPDNN
jgi:hypothetical protein